MRQLVSKQSAPAVRARGKLIRAEHNVVSYCVSIGADISRRLLGSTAGMHPHARKVMTKALLHVLPKRRVQRPAGAGEDAVYAGGRGICLLGRSSRVALDARRCIAYCGMCRRRQHLISNPVRFLLVAIIG